jgi:hypothetical protein
VSLFKALFFSSYLPLSLSMSVCKRVSVCISCVLTNHSEDITRDEKETKKTTQHSLPLPLPLSLSLSLSAVCIIRPNDVGHV